MSAGRPLIDARDKAGARTRYATDLTAEGLCHGVAVRSPHAHARVVTIDPAPALALPGVLAVVGPEDAPPRDIPGEPFYDRHVSARPALWVEPPFAGAPVAAVAGETPEAARAGAAAVAVEYAELPAVLDPAEGGEAVPFGPITFEQGDPDAAFERAAHVVEDELSTSTVQAAALEPYACLVEPTEDGGLTVRHGTPAPFELRRQLAAWLDVPAERVRVHCPPVGGGFGARMDDLPYVAAVLARRVARPVRMVLERAEGFVAGRVRHGTRLKVRSALDADGRLLARELEAVYDVGGHADLGPYVILRALRPLALFRAPALRFTGRLVTTNRPVGGATRGFGNPQATFAVEVHNQHVCERLGLDPVAFRREHLLRAGDDNPSVGVVDTETGRWTARGARVSSCRVAACLEEAAGVLDDPGAPGEPHLRRGAGIACAMHTSGKGRKEVSTARVTLKMDGRVRVKSGAPDQGGTGVATMLAQVVAGELGLPVEDVAVELGDTAEELEDSGAHASGRTYVAGAAALAAAREVAARRDAGEPAPLTATVRHRPESNAPPFAACGAVVDVDPGTGQVRVVRLRVAVDAGRIVNPLHARGQVRGAAVMGLGLALLERLDFDGDGHLVTRGLNDYGVPRSVDVPDVEVVFVGEDEPTHPLGAKGIGEIGLIPVAPAVANAVADATGARVRRLPLSPEEVWRALQAEPTEGPCGSR